MLFILLGNFHRESDAQAFGGVKFIQDKGYIMFKDTG